jgi:hypothetical protein
MIEVEDVMNASKPGVMGAAAALLGYLANVAHRGAPFSRRALFLSMFSGGVLGTLVQYSWPPDLPGMGAAISLIGMANLVFVAGVQDGVPTLTKRLMDWLAGRIK